MQFTAYLFNLHFMVSPQLKWHARYRRNDKGSFIVSTRALVFCNTVLEMGTEIDHNGKSIARKYCMFIALDTRCLFYVPIYLNFEFRTAITTY